MNFQESIVLGLMDRLKLRRVKVKNPEVFEAKIRKFEFSRNTLRGYFNFIIKKQIKNINIYFE
jgi:hypothetical protein